MSFWFKYDGLHLNFTIVFKSSSVTPMAKPSTVASGKRQKAVVFHEKGNKTRTASGLTKADLMRTKTGKIVTKRQHARGKKAYKYIKGWTIAIQKAKKKLNLQGFVAIKKGTFLYEMAKAIYTA